MPPYELSSIAWKYVIMSLNDRAHVKMLLHVFQKLSLQYMFKIANDCTCHYVS
jgi:hypothetical protein